MNGSPTSHPVQPISQRPAPTTQASDPRAKSPALACFLSVCPGLGQVYVGYYQRGFVHALTVAGIITVLASSRGDEAFIPLFGLFLFFFWLYNIIDAGRRASLYNQLLAGTELIEPPEDLKMPGVGGSIVGGVVLIVGGFVMLLNTRFGISLDWLADWWPVIPMAFGVFLVAKAVQEKAARPEKP